jgi:hypothetical protein
MAVAPAQIVVKIKVERPIDLGDFVSAFTSVASQYDKFIREKHPELTPEARIFVSDVRRGSIVASLIPFLTQDLIAGVYSVIEPIEQIAVTHEFIRRYGAKLKAYFRGGRDKDATKSDLKDLMGAVAPIANDPNGRATVEAVAFEDGKRKIKAAIKFGTPQARRAVEQLEKHRDQIEHRTHADYERALMTFKQANVKGTPVGKRTGEWVQIETISDKELPLIYASDLAERRIKHEILEAEDNVFKKGFVVDVNVETRGGRPVAYRVTNLHQVIDLPDDEVYKVSQVKDLPTAQPRTQLLPGKRGKRSRRKSRD